jgi:hypothetical protein
MCSFKRKKRRKGNWTEGGGEGKMCEWEEEEEEEEEEDETILLSAFTVN